MYRPKQFQSRHTQLHNTKSMNFLHLIRRFVPPYKGQMALKIFFNLLSTILTLFYFMAIIPVLQLLFNLSDAHSTYTDLSTVSGLDAYLGAL